MASNYCADNEFSSQSSNFSLLQSIEKILKPLDEVLRCRICDEHFANCMVTKCNHNYCSLCIRKSMSYKTQCPTCFQVASEPELQNNRLVDEILRTYLKVRDSLQNAAYLKSSPAEIPHTVAPADAIIKKELFITDSQSDSSEDSKDVFNKTFGVSCPVCYKSVPEDRINFHLDSCLKVVARDSERKTLPKLVYHLLSDKEIRQKLRDCDLSSKGDRQTLIRRHKNFVIAYNANCDSLEPKPVSELIREIEVQELEERVKAYPSQSQVHRKSNILEIEKEHENYVQEHKSQFSSLIKDIQQRQLNKSTVKQEIDENELRPSHSSRILKSIRNVKTKQDSTSDSDSSENEVEPISPPPKDINLREIETIDVYDVENTSKSCEDSENPDECPSPSWLDDLEPCKSTQLNLLRKRKKGRVNLSQKSSPKRK